MSHVETALNIISDVLFVKKEERTTEDILISITLRRLLNKLDEERAIKLANKLDEERAIKLAIISRRESHVHDTAIEVGWFNSKRCVFVSSK